MSVVDISPLKIGVLFSLSGVTAVVERTQFNAVSLAVDEINSSGGVRGRPLEIVSYDCRSSAKTASSAAQALLTEEGVEFIFGCYMSSTRKAALPIVERHGGLLFYPTLYEGFEFSPSCIYSGAAPNQNIIGLAQYLMHIYGDRFYLIGSNYVYPYETNRIMRDFIVANGGHVVEERYVPLQPKEGQIQTLVEDVKRQSDAVVISTVVGDSITELYREYRRANLNPDRMPIASLTTGEPEVAAMGAEFAEGHITSAPYFQSISSGENQRFVRAFQAKSGSPSPISACAEAAYIQVHLFADAARKAESVAPEKIKKTLPECVFTAPQGTVRVDGENNHTYLWPRIGQVRPDGQFEIVQDSPAAMKPDPYLVMPTDQSWSIRVESA